MVHAMFDACAHEGEGSRVSGRKFLDYPIRGTMALSTTVEHPAISVSTKVLIRRRVAAADVIPRQFDQGSQIEKSQGTDRHSDSLGFLAFCFPSLVHASATRYRTPESALEWMHRKCAEYDGRDDGQRAIGRDQLNGRSYPNATLKGPSMFRRKIAHGRSPTSCRPKQISPCLGCKTP